MPRRVSDAVRSLTSVPRIAVGLPVYNGERYVGEAIESILSQTYADFELVISDNASEDFTEEICREFAQKDPRIRYERNPENLGLVPNFNRCLLLASETEFFKWSAHDDLLSETFLERCVEALDDDSARVLAFPTMEFISADKELIHRQLRPDLSITSPDPVTRMRQFVEFTLESDDLYWSYFGLIRRSALRANPNESYIASDQVFLLELALRGKFIQVSEARFLRRAHPDAWTMRKDRTPRADAVWFDARANSRIVLPHFTLYRNYFRGVSRSPLSAREKTQCRRTLVYKVVREWRNPAGDVRYALRGLLRRVRAAATRATGTVVAAIRIGS